MIILNRKVSPKGFLKYIDDPLHSCRYINKLILHHTSSDWSIWQGSASMLHYWNLYRSRGWDGGPHIFIAPDGIWLFTPINKVGNHSGGKGVEASVGIEVVGRYFNDRDIEQNMPERTKFYTAFVVESLMSKYNLKIDEVFKHLDFDPDCFCTPVLDRKWIAEEIVKYEDEISNIRLEYENTNHAS